MFCNIINTMKILNESVVGINKQNQQIIDVNKSFSSSGDFMNDLKNNLFVKYNVSIDVYEHRDSSFSTVTVNGTSTVKFDPSDAKKFTTFTGSTIDNSDIED